MTTCAWLHAQTHVLSYHKNPTCHVLLNLLTCCIVLGDQLTCHLPPHLIQLALGLGFLLSLTNITTIKALVGVAWTNPGKHKLSQVYPPIKLTYPLPAGTFESIILLSKSWAGILEGNRSSLQWMKVCHYSGLMFSTEVSRNTTTFKLLQNNKLQTLPAKNMMPTWNLNFKPKALEGWKPTNTCAWNIFIHTKTKVTKDQENTHTKKTSSKGLVSTNRFLHQMSCALPSHTHFSSQGIEVFDELTRQLHGKLLPVWHSGSWCVHPAPHHHNNNNNNNNCWCLESRSECKQGFPIILFMALGRWFHILRGSTSAVPHERLDITFTTIEDPENKNTWSYLSIIDHKQFWVISSNLA